MSSIQRALFATCVVPSSCLNKSRFLFIVHYGCSEMVLALGTERLLLSLQVVSVERVALSSKACASAFVRCPRRSAGHARDRSSSHKGKVMAAPTR